MAFPVSVALIEAAEAELGCEFPSELRARLEGSNGGEVFVTSDLYPEGDYWELHTIVDGSDRKRLARSMRASIVAETSSARNWTAFPQGAVAVGSNGSGDLLILASGSTRLWIWDHETAEIYDASPNWTRR